MADEINHADFLRRVDAEIDRARKLHPMPNATLAAATEEIGEVARALLDLQRGDCTRGDLVEECVQLAAMAARIAIEGDSGFPASVTGEGDRQ